MADLSRYDPVIDAAATEWGVHPNVLRALILQESGGREGLTSKAGAGGLTQIMPDTAKGLGMTNPADPAQQIFGAAKYLAEGYQKEGSTEGALLYYHGGPDWRKSYGPESRGYVPGVAGHFAALNKASTPAAQTASVSQPAPAPASASANDDYSDFLKRTGAAEPAATGAPAASEPDYGDFLKRTGAAVDPAPDAPAVQPTPTSSPQPLLARVGAGIQQGVMDVAGTGAKAIAQAGQWVDDRVPALAALDQAAGMDNAGTAARVDAGRQAFQQAYGNDTAAGVGRIGGQLVAGAPVALGANIAAGAAGGVVAGSAGRALLTGQLGSGIARIPSLAAQGAILGASSEAATGGNPGVGAIYGAVAGPVGVGAANAVVGLGNKLLGRGAAAVAPEVAQLADLAQTKYGIPLRADQLSNSGAVRMAGDVVNRLPMTGGSEFTGQQLAAYNRAVANTIGEKADALTPQVMTAAKKRIGGMFDNVESKMSIPVAADNTLLGKLGQIEADAAKTMTPDQANIIRNQITDVLDKAVDGGGALDGAAFRNFVKRDTPLDRVANSNDPNVSHYAGELQDALREALERSLPPGSAVLKEYQAARLQYRNLKTIENLVAKAPTGNVSPALMMGRALANDPQMAYTGGGELGDLARIGQQFLKSPANSGTAERSLALSALMGAGQMGVAALTGTGGYMLGGLPAAALGGGGALVAGQMASHWLQDPAVVNRLIQQGLKPRLAPIGGRLMQSIQPYVAPAGALALPQPSR